jgi:hypothetical protein
MTHSGDCSFSFVGDGTNKILTQWIPMSGGPGESLTLSAWSKSQDALGRGLYIARAVIIYEDETIGIQKLSLKGGTHGWEYIEVSFTTVKPYTSVRVTLNYSKGSGTVWVDDVRLVGTLPESGMSYELVENGSFESDNQEID